MKRISILLLLLFSWFFSRAQLKDSAKLVRESSGFSLFTNVDTLTENDYLLSIEKVFQTLNKAAVMSQSIPSIHGIRRNLDEDDSALVIIKNRLSVNDKELSVRNLQMYNIILQQINKNSKSYASQLKQYDSILNAFKRQILDLQKDSIVKLIFKEPALIEKFKPELVQIAQKWQRTDSVIRRLNFLIDNSLTRTSNNSITTDELLIEAQNLRRTTGSRAFSKEKRYLWEPKSKLSVDESKSTDIGSEKTITNYYFSHTDNLFLLLLFCGIVFFVWVFFNIKSISRHGKTSSLDIFKFRYLYPVPFFSSMIFMLNLAPLFDLDAPFIYIATIEFLIMLTLTFSFAKRLPRHLFFLWLLFIGIFLVQSFSRYLGLPLYYNRLLLLILNLLSVGLGLYAIGKFRKQFANHKFLILSAGIYALFSFFAVISNISGRVTMMQILGSTGTYAFIQTASLLVFIEVIKEAVLLQIQASRIRKGYPDKFKFKKIGDAIAKMAGVAAVIIWFIVFATNLNVYNYISNTTTDFLATPRNIGNFVFTFSGLILFILILWISNFLQKYLPYFFGDVGDISVFNSKAKGSGLMIFRLILLVAGFLMAIAASGLALDKITVIIGALSVGIGLGLQGIVNNFVSGIILIFDKSLRIGDSVEIGDKKGRVKEISLRASRLVTPEGAEVIIPNGEILSKNFINWSLGNNYIRSELSVTVDKAIDKDELKQAINETAKAAPGLLAPREAEIYTNSISSDSVQLMVYFWSKDVRKREEARSKIYQAIYQYLQSKDIHLK